MTSEPPESRLAGFGPNEWLVDEIYQQFLSDRTAVDPAWWEFFEGYTPPDYSPLAARVAPWQPPPMPAIVVEAPSEQPAQASTTTPADDVMVLKGPSARVVANMETSL